MTGNEREPLRNITEATFLDNLKAVLGIGTPTDTPASGTLMGSIKKEYLAWDTTTTANVVYYKYPNYIKKTDLTACTNAFNIGGTWADRATLTYDESGV
jgi:hypothetical protein